MQRTLSFAALIAIGAAFAPAPAMAQTEFSLFIGSAPPAPLYERAPGMRHGHVWVPGHWEWLGHGYAWVPGHYIVARPGYVYAPPRWHQRRGGWYMEPGRWDRDRNGVPDLYQRRGHDPLYAGGYGDGRVHYGAYQGDYYRDQRRHGYYDRDQDGVPDRYQRRGYRDTDRDGVPNRYDRDLDNDGVHNRYDHDVDGDGIPNYHDHRPHNPYRY